MHYSSVRKTTFRISCPNGLDLVFTGFRFFIYTSKYLIRNLARCHLKLLVYKKINPYIASSRVIWLFLVQLDARIDVVNESLQIASLGRLECWVDLEFPGDRVGTVDGTRGVREFRIASLKGYISFIFH